MKTQTLFILFSLMAMSAQSFQAVDINKASFEQISLLPGIGDKLAQTIISFRSSHGQISSMNDLAKIPGLNQKKLAGIKDQLIFSSKPKIGKKIEQISLSMPKKSLMPLPELEVLALKAVGLEQLVDRSWERRVRRAAWLPKVSALFDLDQGDVTTEKKVLDKSESRLLRDGQKMGFELRLTFELEKLIFNSDELEVAKMSLKRLEKRDEVLAKVHKLYFRYLSLMQILSLPVDSEIFHSHETEMKEIAAGLDALSTGKFSQFQALSEMDSAP